MDYVKPRLQALFAQLQRIDGRYFLFGSHLSLFYVAVTQYGLPRTEFQIISAYLTAVVTEILFHYWTRKYPKASLGDRIFSALSEAAGLLLLVRSGLPEYYIFGCFLTVASKYILVRPDGVHIFNPTNFAIVIGLAIFPNHYFQLFADEYSIQNYPIFHVMAFGLGAIIFGRVWAVTLGWFVGILALGGIMQLFRDTGFRHVVYPELGAFAMIFAFLMITDPRTTPGTHRLRFLFGLSVAVVVTFLRQNHFAFPNFVGLFIVTTVTYALSLRWPWIYKKPQGLVTQADLNSPRLAEKPTV